MNCAKRQTYYFIGINKLLTRNYGAVLARSISAMSLTELLTMKTNGSTKSAVYQPPKTSPKRTQSCMAIKTIVESASTTKPSTVSVCEQETKKNEIEITTDLENGM